MNIIALLGCAALPSLVAASASSALAAGTTLQDGPIGTDPPITIVALGDSYLNGYSIGDVADHFTAKVAVDLRAAGRNVVFEEVGFTDKSSDALDWIHSSDGQALLANPARHVLILEVAQNDCNYLKLEATKANLDQILSALASKQVPVLVVGTVAYTYCGDSYVAAYPAIFPEVATKYGELLYPDFKAGIEKRSEFLGEDHAHPNAAGEAIIVANMLPSVEALITRAK